MRVRTVTIAWLFLAETAVAFAQADPVGRLDATRHGSLTLREAMEAIARSEPPQAVAPLRLLLSHPDPEVARMAGFLLRRMGDFGEAVRVAGAALGDSGLDPAARVSAALALGELRIGAAQAPLFTALAGDPEVRVRVQAARSLGDLARPGAFDALDAAARGDPEPLVRLAAARALGQVPDAAPASLVALLADMDAGVRQEACWALGRRAVRSALPSLIGVLESDPDCRVRSQAAWALGQIGDPAAIEPLRQASASTCRRAVQAAAFALSQLE